MHPSTRVSIPFSRSGARYCSATRWAICESVSPSSTSGTNSGQRARKFRLPDQGWLRGWRARKPRFRPLLQWRSRRSARFASRAWPSSLPAPARSAAANRTRPSGARAPSPKSYCRRRPASSRPCAPESPRLRPRIAQLSCAISSRKARAPYRRGRLRFRAATVSAPRKTVSPPTPESKMPIGRELILERKHPRLLD